MYRLLELWRAVLSLFLPNRCPFCDRLVGMTDYWCDACYAKIQFVEEQPEPPDFIDGILCSCYYGGRVRSAILRMKQGHYSYSIDAFAVMMTELGGEMIAEADFVTAVPSSRRRKSELGYAQAERIAKNIAFRGAKPFRRVLKVTSAKKEQKKLNKEQRRENARRSYKTCNEKYIFGKNILIVDDVSTTGATLSAIAEELKAAGASAVYALVFAKTRNIT